MVAHCQSFYIQQTIVYHLLIHKTAKPQDPSDDRIININLFSDPPMMLGPMVLTPYQATSLTRISVSAPTLPLPVSQNPNRNTYITESSYLDSLRVA